MSAMVGKRMDGKETRKPGGKQVFFEPVPPQGGLRTSKAEFCTPLPLSPCQSARFLIQRLSARPESAHEASYPPRLLLLSAATLVLAGHFSFRADDDPPTWQWDLAGNPRVPKHQMISSTEIVSFAAFGNGRTEKPPTQPCRAMVFC
jgi:hypothetical protein